MAYIVFYKTTAGSLSLTQYKNILEQKNLNSNKIWQWCCSTLEFNKKPDILAVTIFSDKTSLLVNMHMQTLKKRTLIAEFITNSNNDRKTFILQ